jgi:RNA polymerase sigma-70 factor (ECF subfamily)
MTLAQLYEQYEALLHQYALRLCRDADRADDLVQDALIRAMGHLDLLGLLAPAQRRAWLYRTLKNLFLDDEEAQRRRARLVEQLGQETSQHHFPSPEAALVNPFDHVPERFRDVVEMRYRLGMNSQEIAEVLDVPAATIRSRLHLALKEMRRNHALLA